MVDLVRQMAQPMQAHCWNHVGGNNSPRAWGSAWLLKMDDPCLFAFWGPLVLACALNCNTSVLHSSLVSAFWTTHLQCAARGTKKRDPGAAGPGSRRRDDDAQMMSEFGRDPDADLMDTTRGLHCSSRLRYCSLSMADASAVTKGCLGRHKAGLLCCCSGFLMFIWTCLMLCPGPTVWIHRLV